MVELKEADLKAVSGGMFMEWLSSLFGGGGGGSSGVDGGTSVPPANTFPPPCSACHYGKSDGGV